MPPALLKKSRAILPPSTARPACCGAPGCRALRAAAASRLRRTIAPAGGLHALDRHLQVPAFQRLGERSREDGFRRGDGLTTGATPLVATPYPPSRVITPAPASSTPSTQRSAADGGPPCRRGSRRASRSRCRSARRRPTRTHRPGIRSRRRPRTSGASLRDDVGWCTGRYSVNTTRVPGLTRPASLSASQFVSRTQPCDCVRPIVTAPAFRECRSAPC